MRQFRGPLALVLLLLPSLAAHAGVAPAASPPATSAVDAQRADWLGRMDALTSTLLAVYTNATTPRAKRTADADKLLKQDAKKLADLARAVHALGPPTPGAKPGEAMNQAPDADPSLALIASLFVDETNRMVRAVERGQVDKARDLATGTASFCIGCHTRSDKLKALVPPPTSVDLSRVHPLARAELYVATHRFSDARREFDLLLAQDRLAQDDPDGWRRAVTHALVLEVRASKSPDGALALVERINNGPVPQAQVWKDADGWRRSLLAWKAEPKPALDRPDAMLREARRLIDEGEATPRKADDHSADVLYLRATSLLHDFLAAEPRGPAAARAFALLAVSYRRLRDVDVWALSRLYDEACIHEAPHTDLARECFERYLADVRSADADQRGRLPADVEAHVELLRVAAGSGG